jgi:thiamine biosynthesis protein ThiC
MKTQIELAREGVCTSHMAKVAEDEGLHVEEIRRGVAAGLFIIQR